MKYSFNFCHGSRTVVFGTSAIIVKTLPPARLPLVVAHGASSGPAVLGLLIVRDRPPVATAAENRLLTPTHPWMIEFLTHMPTDTKIFITMAVLGLAGTLIVLRRLI